MPIGLRAAALPENLTSSYATLEENAAMAMQTQQDQLAGMGTAWRGLAQGLHSMPAGIADAAGQAVEPFAPQYSQPVFEWASQQKAEAQRLMTPDDRLTYDQLQTPGQVGDYIVNKSMSNLPNMVPALVGGVAARYGLRGSAMSPFAKTAIGGSIAAFPQQMGEGVGALREDPTIMANTTPMQRLGASAGYGVATAPLEALPDALLANRLMGSGAIVKNVFKDGFKATAGNAAKHMGAAVAESAVTEGVPEALEQKAQQVMQSHFNPSRDTSKDEHDLKESFFGGWAAGGPTSAVGRGADVAWAQGRGATEAIRNLISPKALPANLMNSDDQSINDWDKQDDAQRNETAKGLADSILNSDATQSMKDAAKSFYEKASNGVSDAWSSLSEALSENEHVKHATGRLDNFLSAVKKANKNAFSSEKNNAEASPEDQAMFEQFTQHLDPKGMAARDTEKKSDLFQGVKAALKSETWHELPWHDLEDEFGTIGRATDAVVKMRENMVRAGQLEHDDEFGKLLDATTKDGQLGERAMMDVVHRYGKEYIGRKPDDRELRDMVRGIRNAMQSRSSMKPEMVKAFDAEMNKSFGEANAAKVMQALGPKNVEKTEFETDDGKGNITGDEISQPKPRFVGSAAQSALKDSSGDSIAAHGGFWRLDKESTKPEEMSALKDKIAEVQDKIIAAKKAKRGYKGHSANLTKLNKQLEGMRTEEHVKQDRARMSAVSRGLRNGKGAEAHFVKHLTPLEYAAAAGISKETVAKHLGTTVEGLEGHPARMIMAEQRQLEKDKLSLDKDDLANMADRTTQAMKGLPDSVLLEGAQAMRVKAALKTGGRESRKALEAEGLEHGHKMDDKVANKLLNNWDHGGNGIFTVHTQTGKYKMSAQTLIETIRKRAVGQMDDASALKAFETGIGSIMAMDGFVKITVDNVWGKQQSPMKDGVSKGKTKANAKYGQFGPYFKLAPGLLLNKAEDASTRKDSKYQAVDAALIEEYERLPDEIEKLQKAEEAATLAGDQDKLDALSKSIDQKLARMEELEARYDELEAARSKYAGEDEKEAVPGVKGATDNETTTPLDHADEPTRDYNDDGTRKQPPGKAIERDGDTTPLKFNGVTLNVRPGVSAKDLTGQARKLLSTIRRMNELVGDKTDNVLGLIGQAAAATKAGDTAARDALLAIASDRIVQAIVDEQISLQEQAAKEKQKILDAQPVREAASNTQEDDTIKFYGAEWSEKLSSKALRDMRQNYAELKMLGAEHIALARKYQADQEAYDEYLGQYTTYVTPKHGASTEGKVEKSGYPATMKDAAKDALDTKVRRQREAHEKDLREQAELNEAGDEEQSRLDSTTARAQRNAQQARQAAADKHEETFEQALTDVEKLKQNLGDTATALRAAYAALKQSYVDGKVNKDLVPQLRAALASFRATAGDAARIVIAAVQQFIKEYQAAGVTTRAQPTERFNAEGSEPAGTPVTTKDMADIKDYITKVLGPKVELRLSKALGGNSASWARKPNGEALIKIAINAANPLSKAHHEAMHEFFQRLMDDGSPAAEVLRTAANNPLVTRQIEQFFHNDANYAAIKAQIASDEHERVAYMFQLWAAGKLKVGPKAEGWFQKIVSFLREVSGVLSNDQKAETLMAHFHDGKMADANAVAEVLANDPKLVQDLVERSDKLMTPLAQRLAELTYTSQNMLTESGVKSFEKIGRLFSTETGRKNEAMSFFDAKTMKTNQMNDRLVQILSENGVDEKDIGAALDGLQQGKTSQDPKIARIQNRVRKMLDQIHNYMTEKQADGKPLLDVKKLTNYFPRAWDVGHIADNKSQFVTMLQADHFKNTGKVMSESIATGIADKLILDRGAEPVNEDELESGYTPFMAAANKRVLDFITDPKFAEFQQKDMGHILSTYIAQAVHRVEYTRRFGKNGTGLRSMVHDGIGEVVGPEWATARGAAETTLKNLKAQYKKAGMTPDKITEKLHEKGYRYGEVQTQHIQAELTTAEAKDKFNDFEPKLRRSVRAIMAMEGTLGADISPKLRKLGSSLIVYENLRLLSMSLFSQVIDPLGVLVRGGTLNDAFETFKRGVTGTVAAWKGTPMEDRMSQLAMQLGIVDAGGMINSQGNAYASVYLGKTAQKINDRLFRWNGVEGFSQGTRVGAMMAAISFIKTHSTLPNEHSERWLAELNLKPADVKLVGDELDYHDPKIQQAIFRWVETAILRPNASMRPAWASDPHWALIFHMKQFTYAMQKVILERIHNEVKHNNYDPAIAMVLTYVPAMMAADFLRGLMANGGEEPPWKRKWKFSDYLSDGVQRAGLLGVPQFALDTAKWGPGELAGPAAEQVLRAGERLNKDVRRDIRLDDVAALTGSQIDIQKAEDFNGVSHAAKRTLRDALPVSSLTKRYVFDEIAGK